MRNKILSLLVLLLTAASGAWAEQTVVMPGLMAPTDNSTTIDENTWKWVQVWTAANNLYMDFEIKDGSQFTGDFTPTCTQLINGLKAYGLDVCGENGKVSTVQLLSADGKVLKTAEINKALVYDKNNKWVVKTTKTTAGTRKIYIPDALVEEIMQYGMIFKGWPNTLLTGLNRYQDKLGIPRFRFHDLRHFFASYAHSQGISDADIMASGGWSSDYTMKNVYRHEMNARESQKKLFDGLL